MKDIISKNMIDWLLHLALLLHHILTPHEHLLLGNDKVTILGLASSSLFIIA